MKLNYGSRGGGEFPPKTRVDTTNTFANGWEYKEKTKLIKIISDSSGHFYSKTRRTLFNLLYTVYNISLKLTLQKTETPLKEF